MPDASCAVCGGKQPAELGGSRHCLQGIVDSVDGIVWEFDLSTFCFTFVSDRAVRFLGYPLPAWYRPGFWTDILHPEDRDWAVRFCVERTRCKEDHTFEYRVVAQDGRVVWVRDIVSVVVEHDQPVRLRGIMVDVTQRKAAESRLVLLNFALDHAREVVCLVNDEGRLLYINDEACRALGREQAALVDRHAAEVFGAFAGDGWQACLNELRAGTSPIVETHLVTKDGVRVPVETTVTRFQHGGTAYILAVGRDIRERQRLERELRALNQDLERRVLLRTAQYELANRELEAFAYSVSHDLRTPLRHIEGYLGLLRKKAEAALGDDCRRYMDTISRATLRMGELIDALLAFSRLGRQALSPERVELEPLVREVVAEFGPEVAGREVQWRISALPAVQCDRVMLRSVVSNIVGNALKFTRGRQPAEIEVGWRQESGASGEAVVFVRDNGTGFNQAYAHKLFGVFQRLHRAEEFEGHGIGLANVRRIIARHGGRTWAEGKVDRGATFFFSLPICDSAE